MTAKDIDNKLANADPGAGPRATTRDVDRRGGERTWGRSGFDSGRRPGQPRRPGVRSPADAQARQQAEERRNMELEAVKYKGSQFAKPAPHARSSAEEGKCCEEKDSHK